MFYISAKGSICSKFFNLSLIQNSEWLLTCLNSLLNWGWNFAHCSCWLQKEPRACDQGQVGWQCINSSLWKKSGMNVITVFMYNILSILQAPFISCIGISWNEKIIPFVYEYETIYCTYLLYYGLKCNFSANVRVNK